MGNGSLFRFIEEMGLQPSFGKLLTPTGGGLTVAVFSGVWRLSG